MPSSYQSQNDLATQTPQSYLLGCLNFAVAQLLVCLLVSLTGTSGLALTSIPLGIRPGEAQEQKDVTMAADFCVMGVNLSDADTAG